MDKDLCDLGASISLMPYSIYKRLKHVNELSPTRLTLQLADRRIVYAKGILYDVDLRMGKLTYRVTLSSWTYPRMLRPPSF